MRVGETHAASRAKLALAGHRARRRGHAGSLRLASLLLAGLLLLGGAATRADPIAERLAQPYPYLVVDQDLPAVLRECARNLGLKLELGQAVSGRVRGKAPIVSAAAFLDRLAGQHEFDWYVGDGRLFISASRDAVEVIEPLHRLSFASLQSSLASLAILDERFPLRHDADRNFVIIKGPPRYAQLIRQTMAGLMPPPPAPAPVVTVIHGRARLGGDS